MDALTAAVTALTEIKRQGYTDATVTGVECTEVVDGFEVCYQVTVAARVVMRKVEWIDGCISAQEVVSLLVRVWFNGSVDVQGYNPMLGHGLHQFVTLVDA